MKPRALVIQIWAPCTFGMGRPGNDVRVCLKTRTPFEGVLNTGAPTISHHVEAPSIRVDQKDVLYFPYVPSLHVPPQLLQLRLPDDSQHNECIFRQGLKKFTQ